MNKTIFFICVIGALIVSSLSVAQEYDPYTLPGFHKYQQGRLGSRQQARVNEMQKKYPDGYAVPGPLSYAGGDFKSWQDKFYAEFVSLSGLNEKEIASKAKRFSQAWIFPFDFSGGKKNILNKLLKPMKEGPLRQAYDETGEYDCKSEDARGRPLYSDYYPPRYKAAKDHIELFSCRSDHEGIRVYKVGYTGFEGHKISAYLFVPNNAKNAFYQQAKGKVPTLIYYHGHESTKEDAAFNPKSYVRGIAYHAALNGFLVLAPDVRGFGESKHEENHQAIADRLHRQGSHFLAAAAMDAIYAQDFLENANLREFGLKYRIDENFNAIGGVSMGGLISLMAGALDKRFEVVSMQGIFLGYEVLFSKFHCPCSKMPRLLDQANIFDVALLVTPRTLHVGMGAKDPFYNNYAKSAIEMFAYDLTEAGYPICYGRNDESGLGFLRNMSVRDKFQAGVECPLVLEIDKEASHEVIGYGYQFHLFWHDYLSKLSTKGFR
ncbi:MAG: acetyl xylan esterase [uncultured bacterium]|nr:MAG: acetyl xylan esterase [uncultured bacterium]HLD45485.1 alpha/beta fold hydrolase [bacterium]